MDCATQQEASSTVREDNGVIPTFFGEKVHRWLTRYAAVRTENWHAAEDLASEAMLVIWKLWQAGKFDLNRPGALKFSTRVIDKFLERNRRQKLVSLSGENEHLARRRSSPNEIRPTRLKAYHEAVESLREMSTAKQFERTMAYLSGDTIERIAESQGVGEQAARTSVESGIWNFRKRHGIELSRRLRIA